jgi:hypothetical protein
MTVKDTREFGKFLKVIGLILFWGLGVIPLGLFIFEDVLVFHPYAALISVISGSYIYVRSRKYSR